MIDENTDKELEEENNFSNSKEGFKKNPKEYTICKIAGI